MPGVVVFRRRWSVGSDDFVVPAVFLLILHSIWLVVLGVLYGMVKEDGRPSLCWTELGHHVVGYLALLSGCLVMEAVIAFVSMRGTILDAGPRASMQYLLYVRLVLFIAEVVWLILGVVWLVNNYESCKSKSAKEAILGIVVCNWCVVVSVVITTWCTFDAAGRSWVKMKRYQRSMKDTNSKFQYRRSGNRNRNWRQRKVLRAYQDSWDHRFRLLFCCVGKKDRNSTSFSDIARLLSEFFRDLDVVPSDVVAGLVLLRRFQKEERRRVIKSHKNDVYEFLSGVAITPRTRFLQLSTPEGEAEFTKIVHYMRFALAVYGWPMFIVTTSPQDAFKLCPLLSCCQCCHRSNTDSPEVVEDNCCGCNAAGLLRMAPSEGFDLIYVTYHVSVGETPFFVALDHTRNAIVISIRGTLSMKDVITDLNAESEPLPMDSVREDWLGHKGMVSAAEYVRKKLREDNILGRAFAFDLSRGTNQYDLVLVGHSLGAGTAAILAILLKQEHPNLSCFAYSPPGGLLSMPAVEYTKSFITSVVVGKDVVPRIGLHQMEALRADLISAIQRSREPKWKTIASSFRCCGDSIGDLDNEADIEAWTSSRTKMRDQASHPSDSSIALTVHPPLYPPGRILHVVRNHPKREQKKYDPKSGKLFHNAKPVYQAIWVDNKKFHEVLISPCMIADHMPDKVLEALEKVLETPGPVKPQRQGMGSYHQLSSNAEPETNMSETNLLLSHSATTPVLSTSSRPYKIHSSPSTPLFTTNSKDPGTKLPISDSILGRISTPPHKLLLETSFTGSPVSSPGPRPDLRNHVSAPGLTWEILSALEDQLLSSGPFTQALNEEFLAYAPLASPEAFSETSSLASRVSFLMRESSRNSRTKSSLFHSPASLHKGNNHKVLNAGSGYCFYVSTPPAMERSVLQKEVENTSEEESDSPRSVSPVSFITLEPILPKEVNPVEEIRFCKTSDCDSAGKCCMNDNLINHNYFHLLSKDIIKLKKEDTSQSGPVNEVKLQIDLERSPSPSESSASVESEKGFKLTMTSSQMSRDSGYGERSSAAIVESRSFNQDGWAIPQQEYGRSDPPHLPFYFYANSSPQISPVSSSLCVDYFLSPSTSDSSTSRPTVMESSHPLHLATPLLHNLGVPCVSPTLSNMSSESSV